MGKEKMQIMCTFRVWGGRTYSLAMLSSSAVRRADATLHFVEAGNTVQYALLEAQQKKKG